MKFDPEAYTITIRKEEVDGDTLYVGRVAEFPNISAFEDTFETARTLVVDAIQTLKKIADETHLEFPFPYPAPADEFSGRVTLRLPKSLHAKVSRIAAQEDVSVNQYLVTAISTYVGEIDGISKVVSEAAHYIAQAAINSFYCSWSKASFQLMNVTPSRVSIPSEVAGTKFLNGPMSQPMYAGAADV